MNTNTCESLSTYQTIPFNLRTLINKITCTHQDAKSIEHKLFSSSPTRAGFAISYGGVRTHSSSPEFHELFTGIPCFNRKTVRSAYLAGKVTPVVMSHFLYKNSIESQHRLIVHVKPRSRERRSAIHP